MNTGSAKAIAVLLSVFAASASAEPLRTVHDLARDRVWVLANDAVYLQQGAQKTRFELPDWAYAAEPFACAPDLAVDGQGRAVVTSNVAPIVWRIDPANARVTRHSLTLNTDTTKEVGFTGLVYAPGQDVFFAVSGTLGSLWRIDPMLRRAQKVPVSVPLINACGLTADRTRTRHSVVLCADGFRAVHLSPDQRSGYVFARRCAEDSSL